MVRVPFDRSETDVSALSFRSSVEESAEEKANRERRAQFASARNERLRSARSRRLEQLLSDDAERGDTMAETSWTWLGRASNAAKVIEEGVDLRSAYVARDPVTAKAMATEISLGGRPVGAEPPLAKLASDAGRSLRLHLAVIGFSNIVAVGARKVVNDPERLQPGRRSAASRPVSPGDPSRGLRVVHSSRDVADWAKVLGVSTPGKARTARVHETLKRLQQHDLVQLAPGRPSIFTVLAEDGRRRPWCPPSLDPIDRWFNVPYDFWRNRWYLWLTPAEVATLMAIYHGWFLAPPQVVKEGLGLPESVRRARYAMSGERYSALHELIEFGLVEMVSPSLRPVPGSTPGSTHHVRPVPSGLSQPARERIVRSLEAASLPPRLSGLATLQNSLKEELQRYQSAQTAASGG